MDMVTISLFVVLEAVILLAIAVVLLTRKNKQLSRRLQSLDKPVIGDAEGFLSMESGYLPYLEKEILDTRARLELSQMEAGSDASLSDALGHRLVLLEAEKRVTELCNDFPKRRWEHVAELFAPQVSDPEADEAEPGPEEFIEDAGGVEEDRLAQAQKRIRSLEKFRDHFFQMKKQIKALDAAKQSLADKIAALVPEAERSEELRVMLDELTDRQDRLLSQADMMEVQAGELQAAGSTEYLPAEDRQASITELHGVLGQQGDVIQSIMQVIEKGRQQPSPEMMEQLENQLRELEHKYYEATTCIEIMGQENERLQDKVDRKDRRIERVEEEKNESVADLQEQVDKQKRKMSELHEVVGDLQLEAEKAEQLKAKLEQFDLASRDMNMCIQVLEEENELLNAQLNALEHVEQGLQKMQQEQQQKENDIAALQQQVQTLEAQLEEKGQKIEALEQGQPESRGSYSEELKQQVEDLKVKLEEKTRQAKEVEERYASMEQEYLTLYEEANS